MFVYLSKKIAIPNGVKLHSLRVESRPRVARGRRRRWVVESAEARCAKTGRCHASTLQFVHEPNIRGPPGRRCL